MKDESFRKSERICSKQLVEQLFGGGNATMAAFPLRAVYMLIPTPGEATTVHSAAPTQGQKELCEDQVEETSHQLRPHSPHFTHVGCATDWPVEVPVQVLISVSKRKYHHAVDRNRMKRQIREAYRRRKQPLWSLLRKRGQHLALAFICLSDRPCTSEQVQQSMDRILRRISERLSGAGKTYTRR